MDKKLKIDINFEDELKMLLDQSIELQLLSQESHYNIEGSQFGPLHTFFQEQYEYYFELVDTLSERIRQLGFLVSLSVDYSNLVSSDPNVILKYNIDSLYLLATSLREVIAEVNKTTDFATGNILIDTLQDVEKQVWKVRSIIGATEG